MCCRLFGWRMILFTKILLTFADNRFVIEISFKFFWREICSSFGSIGWSIFTYMITINVFYSHFQCLNFTFQIIRWLLKFRMIIKICKWFSAITRGRLWWIGSLKQLHLFEFVFILTEYIIMIKNQLTQFNLTFLDALDSVSLSNYSNYLSIS